jgi:GTP-binding protein
MRSIRAIESADVCILMLDASDGIEQQDLNILRLVEKNKKGLVLVVNKWDLIDKQTNTHLEYQTALLSRTAPFTDIPIVFTSVTEKQRVLKVLEAAGKVYENRSKRIPTARLNEFILPLIERNPPPVAKGKRIKIKYVTQLKVAYPAFVFFCNLPQYIKEPYQRFLENQMRKEFPFTGVTISLYFRQK